MLYQSVVVCLALTALANGATLGGRVYDPSGAVIPGARVFAYDASGKSQLAAASADGQYNFAGLNPGVYRLEVQAPGFASFHQRNIKITEGQQPRVDAAMQVGSIMESMRIEARGIPAASQPAQRIRVGGNVQPAKLLKQAKPVYPDSAKGRGATGVVLLRTIILKDGSTASPVASTGTDPELAQAAIEAVKQWRYQPTLLNGEPVETLTTISIQFDLK